MHKRQTALWGWNPNKSRLQRLVSLSWGAWINFGNILLIQNICLNMSKLLFIILRFLVPVLVENGYVLQSCVVLTTPILRPCTTRTRTTMKDTMKIWTTKLIKCSFSIFLMYVLLLSHNHEYSHWKPNHPAFLFLMWHYILQPKNRCNECNKNETDDANLVML